MDLEGIDCVVVDAEKSGSKIRYFNISNIKGAGSVSAPSWLPVEKEMISDDEKNEVLRAFNYDSSNWEGYKRIEKTYDENGELSETVVTYYSDSTKNMVQQKENMLDGSTTDIFFEFAGLIAYSAYYENGLSDPELDISNVEDWVKMPEEYVIQEEFTTEDWRLDEWGEKRFKITYVHESKVFYSYIIQQTGTTYSNLCRTHCVTVDSEGELISCEYVEFYRSGHQLTKSVTMFNYTGDVEMPDWVDNYLENGIWNYALQSIQSLDTNDVTPCFAYRSTENGYKPLRHFNSLMHSCNSIRGAFDGCKELESWYCVANWAKEGQYAFQGCINLKHFRGIMREIEAGYGMFGTYSENCTQLDLASVQFIAGNFGWGSWNTLSLGVSNTLQGSYELEQALNKIYNNGWNVEVIYSSIG
jgi:hypothetical protein